MIKKIVFKINILKKASRVESQGNKLDRLRLYIGMSVSDFDEYIGARGNLSHWIHNRRVASLSLSTHRISIHLEEEGKGDNKFLGAVNEFKFHYILKAQNFGQLLKALRNYNRMSLTDLGQKIGVTAGLIAKWEKSGLKEYCLPNQVHLELLMDILIYDNKKINERERSFLECLFRTLYVETDVIRKENGLASVEENPKLGPSFRENHISKAIVDRAIFSWEKYLQYRAENPRTKIVR